MHVFRYPICLVFCVIGLVVASEGIRDALNRIDDHTPFATDKDHAVYSNVLYGDVVHLQRNIKNKAVDVKTMEKLKGFHRQNGIRCEKTDRLYNQCVQSHVDAQTALRDRLNSYKSKLSQLETSRASEEHRKTAQDHAERFAERYQAQGDPAIQEHAAKSYRMAEDRRW